MDDSGDFEVICGPCSKTRVSVRATQYCRTCKEPFCDNCMKLHRATPWAIKHDYISLVNNFSSKMSGGSSGDPKPQLGIADAFTLSLKAIKQKAAKKTNAKSSLWNKVETNKLDYMKNLAKQHDHEQMELENELFCEQHQSIFCELCKSKQHRNCTEFAPVSEAAASLKKSEKAMEVVNKLKALHKFAGIMVDDRKKEATILECSREDILPRIQLIRQRFNDQFVMLEKALTTDFEELHEKNTKHISQEKEKCLNVQKHTTTDVQELKKAFCDPDSVTDASFLKSFAKVSSKCGVYESFLRDVYDQIQNHDYIFKLDEKVLELADAINSIGTLEHLDTAFRLPAFLQLPLKETSSRLKMPENSRVRRPKSNYAFASSQSDSVITAIGCLDNGDIAIIDKMEFKLKIHHKKSRSTSMYEFTSSPWDVTILPADEMAVTIPGNNEILILKLVTKVQDEAMAQNKTGTSGVEEYEINLIKSIPCNGECWGIVFCNDSLYGTFDCYSEASYIQRIDIEDGIVDLPLEVNAKNFKWEAPQHIACDNTGSVLYITDAENHCVVATGLDGEVKFCYTDSELGCPTGICVGRDDNIYVLARDTSTVHKIDPDGKSGEIILQEDDDIFRPRAFCYNYHDNTVITAKVNSSKLKAYPIE